MKLVVDIGNTLTKLAVFDNNTIVEIFKKDDFTAENISIILQKYPEIISGILSSVRELNDLQLSQLTDQLEFHILNHNTSLPFINKYKTPKTLGHDRLAAVASGMDIYPGKNVLVIDAGTCITYDIVTSRKEYLGGGISPGLLMRFEAMHTFTGKLPFIKPEIDLKIELTGKTTKDSLLAGGQKAILMEVDGMISAYKEQYYDLKVVLGGGDYKYFDKYLKNNIFAAPNLVVIGLKKILDFNEG